MATKRKSYPWEKFYPEGLEWNVEFSPKPLYQILDETAERYPEHRAIDYYGKYYSYAEIAAESDRLAKGLQASGIEKGDRVGILMPNCPYGVIAYFAILKAGGVVVSYNPLYTINELKHQVQDSGTKMMITLNLAQFHEKTGNLLQTTCLERIVVCDLRAALTFKKRVLFNWFKSSEVASIEFGRIHLAYEKLIDNDGCYRPQDIDPEKDTAVIQYTGGTTGVAKGACLSHAAIAANTEQISMWFTGLEEGKEKMLAVIPFFHVFGMTAVMLLSVARACEMVIHSRFDLPQLIKDIHSKKVTLLLGVPTIFNTICHHARVSSKMFKSLKMCISGGAPLPIDVKQQFEALTGAVLAEGYGLSEASPVVTVNPLFGESKPGSVGIPLPGTIVEIRSTEARRKLCPAKEIGEVCVKGPQVMLGYYNAPEDSKNVLRSGRLHTGDMGYLDKSGYLYIVDRIKDVIIASGFNIYPREIEEYLYEHNKIKEAAVIGVDDEKRGQTAKAFIVLRVGEELGEADLNEYLRRKLAAYKVPTVYEFREELPKTLIGKVDKKILIAEEKAKKHKGE